MRAVKPKPMGVCKMIERLHLPWQRWRSEAHLLWDDARMSAERALLPLRALVAPRSLARQMAFVAVASAVGAIIVTALIAAIVVSNSFSSYLQAGLRHSTHVEAERLSAIAANHYQGFLLPAVQEELQTKFFHDPANATNGQIWVVDSRGNVLVPFQQSAVWNTSDPNTIVPALRNAITYGTVSSGALNDPDSFGWLHLSARGYAVEPIYADGTPDSPIIGAVAISSEESLGPAGGPGFIHSVDRAIIISGILIALAVGIIGAFLARRVTKPISNLTHAAAKMADGDLTARVALDDGGTPAEIEQLSATFNDMAAKLEHDVAELRRQERLQRDLVANVAHELATPLTAISGYSELLADDDSLSPQQRAEFSRVIHRETMRLSRMVDQLRQVARLEAGTEKMDLHPTELRPLVEDTLAVLQGESEQREVAIHNDIPADLPLVEADADRLTQVVLNLTDNALRHTPAGGLVTLSAQLEGDVVWVTVADTGPGIAPEDLPRVFERFYRADPSRNRASGGTGLGLAIVKGIVEAHGGQVRAGNNPDGGARMSFSLRLAPVAAPKEAVTVG